MAVLILFIAAAIVLVDQLLKYMAVQFLQGAGQVTAIPHLLDFVYVENRGAAFGMLQNQRWIFILATIVLLVAAVYVLFAKESKHKYFRLNDKLFAAAAALIIGGGLGNLIDRIFLGYVVDYLQLSFFPPVCNFADYCISIGTVLLVVYLLFFSPMAKEEKLAKEAQKGKAIGNNPESGEQGD